MSRPTEMSEAPSGGKKQTKERNFSAIPVEALRELAKLYYWARENKYPDDPTTHQPNFRKGYPASLSYEALIDHALSWNAGETMDEESGVNHMANVAWHAINLIILTDTKWDDRWIPEKEMERRMFSEVKRSIVSDPDYVHGPGDRCFDPKPEQGSIYTPESDPARWDREVEAPRRHGGRPIPSGIIEEKYFDDEGRPEGR